MVECLTNIVKMMASSEKVFFCGRLGAGLAAKISNNYLSGTREKLRGRKVKLRSSIERAELASVGWKGIRNNGIDPTTKDARADQPPKLMVFELYSVESVQLQ